MKILTIVLFIVAYSTKAQTSYRNGLVQIRSTCSNSSRTPWNTKNVGKTLKRWIKSISVLLKEDDLKDKLLGSKYIQMWKDKNEKEIVKMIANIEYVKGSSSIKPVGNVWKKASTYSLDQFQDGFFYGLLDNVNDEFTGDNVIFVYPDMKTVLTGEFWGSYMIGARESKIQAERCYNGIKEILVAPVKENSPIFRFKRPNTWSMGYDYTLVDPYEKKATYIGKSRYDEEGVFAKRNFNKGEIVSYYGGVIQYDPVFFSNQTDQEEQDIIRNLISFGISRYINVLQPYWNITAYRATRGHKHNHSFKYSKTIYGYCYHPRYGPISSVMATQKIRRGEEIFVDYQYVSKNVPDWYRKLHLKELGTPYQPKQ